MNINKKNKIAVLASGNGTNLQAIIDAIEAGKFDAIISIVISDKPEAYALERAKNHKIPTAIVERKLFQSKKEFEEAIVSILKKHDAHLVCLAGFMRIIGRTLLNAYPSRIINIHPALLPSFPGLDVQKKALEYGVKITGCTVHFVDEKTDHGPIICQAAVEVKEDDTVETLKNRILKEEHRIYPKTIQLIVENKVCVEGRRVIIR